MKIDEVAKHLLRGHHCMNCSVVYEILMKTGCAAEKIIESRKCELKIKHSVLNIEIDLPEVKFCKRFKKPGDAS